MAERESFERESLEKVWMDERVGREFGKKVKRVSKEFGESLEKGESLERIL